MNLFITFEGGEGCGKSLQSRRLYRTLSQLSIPAILIHEPGGTPLGERVRYLLKQACQIPVSPLTELLLFNASRSQMVQDVIQPGLRETKIVICDRFTDSTIAYQSYGRGLDINIVKEINQIAARDLKPDLTFLLDVPPDVGLSRKKAEKNDRFEQEALVFHQRVREGFLKMASEDTQRWTLIDATLPRSEVARHIWNKVSPLLVKR